MDSHDEWREMNPAMGGIVGWSLTDESCKFAILHPCETIIPKSLADCIQKFSNGAKFGGFPRIPKAPS